MATTPARNVADFLAAHKIMADAPRTTTDPDLIYSVGTNDRESGRIDLTVTDLTAVLAELALLRLRIHGDPAAQESIADARAREWFGSH